MRWTLMARKTNAWNERTAKSCGPDIPTLISSLRGDDLAGDGDKQSPVSEASTKETVKTNRAGNAGPIRRDRGDYARMLYIFLHARLRVRMTRPAFPASSDERERRSL